MCIFAEIHHVNELPSRFFVSPATMNRWFRRYLHLTPHAFLESKKLSHAKTLLGEGKSVTEACMTAGFSDCFRFIATFYNKFGVTPYKYKRNVK